MNKKIMPVILFLVIIFVLVVAILLVRRKPIVANSWNGAPAFKTTTPTLTLLPEQGWWNDIPTAPGHRDTPLVSPTP